MRTKTKRTLALLLGIMMMFTAIPSSFAALVGSEKAEFEAVLLVKDPSAAAGAFQYKEATEATELSAGDKIMIGIKAKNLHNIAEVPNTPLVDFSMGLTYDPTYLKSEPENRLANGNLSGTKANAALKARLAVDGSFFSADDNDYAYSFDVNDKESEKDATKRTYIWIIHSAAFEDGANSTKYMPNELYMAAIEFEVISVPTPGTKVVALSDYEGDTVLKLQDIESGADAVTYQYENTGNTDTDILAVANFVESNLDLFPAGSVQTGIKVTSDATALKYKDMQDVHGITKVVKALESGDGSEITDYQYYYGPTNSKVGQSVDKNLAGLTEVKTKETNTWNNGVPKAANGQCLYIVAGDYMWNVGVLDVQDASITGLKNASLTAGWATGKNVVGVDDIKFTGGQVTASYNNGKEKAISYNDFATNGLAIYRKGSPYVDLSGNNVKFEKTNNVVVAVKSSVGGTVIESNALSYSGAELTTSYSIKTQPKTAYTYPETLDVSSIVVTVTSNDSSIAGDKTYDQANGTIFDTIKIGNTTVTPGTTKITKAHAGSTIDFYKGSTKVLSSSKITFTPKKVSLTAVSGAAITKVYDKTNALPASANITYGVDGLETGDNAGTVTANAVYSNVNKGENIAITISAPASNSADFNSKYEFNTTMPTTVKGAITPATLKITNITKITTAQQNTSQSGPFKKTGETANQGQFTADATKKLYPGDQVTITYDVEFTEADIKAGANTEVNVTVSNVAITGGTSKDNYTLDSAVPTAKGKVTNRVLSSIKNPVVPTDLTYGDVYPTTIQVTATFEGGVADDTVDANITAPTGGWKVGDNTVTVTYEAGGVTKTTTATINVAPKKINLSDITFRATKQAGATEVTANNTIADGVLVGDDVVTVKAATYTFDESKVNEEQDITVSGITLDGDNAGNYVIVDAEGNPITAETTAQGKGTINQGTTEAPTAINTSVNSSNGSITVTEPVTAGDKKVEYSFDGGLTWTDDATKSDITPGTEYTIQARYKASEDGSTGASDVVTTTVKISQVRLFSVGDDSATAKPQQTFYTAGTEFAEKNITISRVTGTFTDKEGTTAVTFPLTLTSATTDLYVTVKRGGGGGGGSTSYTVKFSAGSHGKITEGKATTSVVLGAKLKATALPTITPDEGYRFIGWSADGETVVDPTTITVSKALSLTALYEEDKVEPTPTPTPLIKNNLKPYASGYDDGMFLPNDYITRAELASMIARLINGDDISNSYKASFADVDDTWYNKYIGYLEDKDVLSGYEDGTFRPNNSVTRGEMCAIIVRAQRYGLIPVDGMFTDVTDEDWAKTYITTLASMNIVSGYEDGTFGTYSPITRAETVAIINRVLDPSTPVITFTPLDIAGHWAEADIMLAVNERQLKNAVTEPTATPEATPEVTAEPTATPETTPEATVEPTATPAA